MRTDPARFVALTAAILAAAVLPSCSRPAPPAAGPPPSELTPVVSVRELMTYWIDPLSDNVFDAVGSDVTEKGIVDTRPQTDEDWAKVEQGAIALAEGANLLKIPRPIAPAHDNVAKNPGELHPEEVQKRVDQQRGVWNAFADAMRTEAIKVREIVKAKDADRLFQAGSDIDRTCESCHLAFWYPGDRAAVERDRNSKVTPGRGGR